MSNALIADFSKIHASSFRVSCRLELPSHGRHTTVLFGPSGCGKTTVLRCLAGLEQPDSGTIRWNDEDWLDVAQKRVMTPQSRRVGMLFQDGALFPHLSIGDNIGFGLPRMASGERNERIRNLLQRFQIAELIDRLPLEVSGGQRQRVALARALAVRPRLLLLDEPLSSLDAMLREQMRHELRGILSECNIPTVLVTHDRAEAIALADHLVIMSRGTILQQGTWQYVFSNPLDLEVARMVGVETIVEGQIVGVDATGLAKVQIGEITLTSMLPHGGSASDSICGPVHVCLKAEDFVLLRQRVEHSSVRNQLPAVVESIQPEGALVRIVLQGGFRWTVLITKSALEEMQLRPGESVVAAIKAPAIHLIPRHPPNR